MARHQHIQDARFGGLPESNAPSRADGHSEPPADAAEEGIAALRALLNAADLYRLRISQHYGRSLAETYALSHIAAGRLSQSDLAARVGLTSGGATAMVDRLEEAGVARRVADPDDRRRHMLEMTELGQELVQHGREGLGRVFEGFPESRLTELAEELHEVSLRLREQAERVAADRDAQDDKGSAASTG